MSPEGPSGKTECRVIPGEILAHRNILSRRGRVVSLAS